MSEELEENAFEGFNLLKDNALAAPAKVVKEKKEPAVTETAEEKALKADAALVAAQLEIDEIAKKKASKLDKELNSEEEEGEEEKIIQEEEAADESSFKAFAGFLREEGMAEFDDESFDDSTEGLKRVWKDSLNKEHDAWVKSFDEDTQKYLEFIENGGKPADFHKYYYNEASWLDFTIETEEDQKYAIREGLRLSGWEDEAEIEEELMLYEDAGKLESKAKPHLARLQKADKENKTLLVEAQKKYAKEQDDHQKAEWKSFRDGLMEKEEISGFKFTKKMKDDLWDYMTKPVDKKTGVTQYQADSQEKGAEARYMFAYLLKNNWDASSLSKDVKNKVVHNLKKNLSNYSDSRSKIKSGTPSKADNEEISSFAGFKGFLKS